MSVPKKLQRLSVAEYLEAEKERLRRARHARHERAVRTGQQEKAEGQQQRGALEVRHASAVLGHNDRR